MTDQTPTMKVINPDRPLDDAGRVRIAELAARQRKANGLLMTAINFVGSQVEDGLKLLPKSAQKHIDTAARNALRRSHDLARTSRKGSLGARIAGDRFHRVIGTMSGALGGLGGLPTALAELPVATTIIFRAVQDVAQSYGEDPHDEETALACLAVFGAGGPGSSDDGVDTAFFGARISITGPALNTLISKVAPRFAAVLSQKLASQAVPLLGAVAGAGTNYAFLNYYVAMAHVHFGLRQLARSYDETQVLEAFHQALLSAQVPVQRKADDQT